MQNLKIYNICKNPKTPNNMQERSKFQFNKSMATDLKKKELANENHFENYLIKKFIRNMQNHLRQRGVSESNISFATEYAKDRITKDNILQVYGKPMQLILQHLANNTLSEIKNYGASYVSPYIKNHPHQ
jgi:hypothetical protein